MSNKAKLVSLALAALALIVTFLVIKSGGNWDYVLPKRGVKIFAIILTGTAIAISTLIFQIITNNRILTPSIIGLDSLYMLIQTFVIFVFGSMSIAVRNVNINFVICVGLMILFSTVLYKVLLKGEGRNIYFLLLMGLIFGTLFSSISSFMQVLIDPNEFLIVQDKMFASFNNVNTKLLLTATISIVLVLAYAARFYKYLDILALGREQAINLGVDYDFVVKRLLIVVSILISISTALVGPITFLGLLIVNVAYQFIHTYKNKYLLISSSLISIIALIGGLLIVERVFTFSTSLSVIINFIGGVYFIYLLLKENKSW